MKVGDIVLYNHGVHETVMVSDQPLAAIVTYVHDAVSSDAAPDVFKINAAVFGKDGHMWAKQGITLWDGDGDAPEARLEFAYPVGSDPFAKDADNLPAPKPKYYDDDEVNAYVSESAWRKPIGAPNDGVPADPGSDVVPRSTRGPNKLASGPATRNQVGVDYPVNPAPDGYSGEWDGDAPSGFEPLVNPPIGPEYKPNAEHPMPNAPEPINKVSADSPANPDRPLD